MTLKISQAKPNPAGKDKNRYGRATPAQLGGEWVDVQNTGGKPVTLDGLELWHKEYPRSGAPELGLVCRLFGTLGPYESLRVHTGVKVPLDQLHQADIDGAKWHSFTGHDHYVWNNDRADTPILWNPAAKADVDRTEYDANPPEGVVLVRVGPKLVCPVAVGYGRRF